MDTKDLKELLPFFVAGSLSPAEREQVEEALNTSETLRKELGFWRQAEAVVRARHDLEKAGHLNARDIVDRAMGGASSDRLLSIDNHLQFCSMCSEELALVTQSVKTLGTVKYTPFRILPGWAKSIRIVYAFPALVVVVAMVLIIFNSTNQQQPSASAPTHHPIPVAKSPAEPAATASLSLTYHLEVRSTSHREIPTLTLENGQTHVKLSVAIPHNAADGIRYNVSLASHDAKPLQIQELVRRYASGEAYDSLQFVVSRNLLPLSGQPVTLTISEVLPPDLRGLTPEEYSFELMIRVLH